MNYATMPAGPEMDRLVALWLGYTFVTFPDGLCPLAEHWKNPSGELIGFRPPPFSSDIGRAWEVVEKMAPREMRMGRTEAGRFYVNFGHQAMNAVADTAPLAICRAALAALEAGRGGGG